MVLVVDHLSSLDSYPISDRIPYRALEKNEIMNETKKKGEGRHELTWEDRSKGGTVAWSKSSDRMRQGASEGGKKCMQISRSCPHCQINILGPAYFKHLKKCESLLDK